jgi:hypothetical protein
MAVSSEVLQQDILHSDILSASWPQCIGMSSLAGRVLWWCDGIVHCPEAQQAICLAIQAACANGVCNSTTAIRHKVAAHLRARI